MNKLYNLVKIVVGVTALVTSLEYFIHIVKWPENTYYYIGDIILWFLFSTFMVNEALTGLIKKR